MREHRRRCLIQAILEIKGALAGVTAEDLLKMNDAELLALFIEMEKLFDEGTQITEPMLTNIEDLNTIVMNVEVDDEG